MYYNVSLCHHHQYLSILFHYSNAYIRILPVPLMHYHSSIHQKKKRDAKGTKITHVYIIMLYVSLIQMKL
jgi:hypothetical protein